MPNFDLKDRAAIAGVGNSQYGRRLMRRPIDLAAECLACGCAYPELKSELTEGFDTADLKDAKALLDECRNRELELERADLRDFAARIDGPRLREQDALALVRFDLPFVGWMRLADIHDEELDPIAEAAMERFEVPSLGTEGRSGVAAEDQRDRLASAK